MALTYDLENDIRYQQGQEKGEERGVKRGREQQAISTTKNLLKLNLSHQQIADSLEVSLDFVQKIADSLKK